MTEKIKKFIKKGNYTKTKIVLLILWAEMAVT